MKKTITIVLILIMLFPICSYGTNEEVKELQKDDGTFKGKNTLEMPWMEFYQYFTTKIDEYGHLFTLEELERFIARTNR